MTRNDITMQDIIAKHAVVRADETAFVSGDRRWSFGRYFEDVNRLASGLASFGIAKSGRIAVVAVNSYELFLLYGASAQLGAVIIPVNRRLKPEEVLYILEDCKPDMVAVSPEHVQELAGVLGRCSFASRRIVLGERQDGFEAFCEILNARPDFRPADVHRHDPFVIIYTAAVAGRPRGAVLTHENIVAAGFQVMIPMKLYPDAVYVALMPLFHVMGLQLAVGVLLAGGRNVIAERFDADQAVALIEREEATIIGTVPPMLSAILEKSSASGKSLRSLRVVASLFDDQETIRQCEKLTGAEFWSGYGQTETSGYITLCPYRERPGSSGREGPMVRIGVVDDDNRPVPTGKPGQIVVRGPVTFQGYWNAGTSMRSVLEDGWHSTGDMGRLDERGYLWYETRKAEKDLIKTGGENVYPAEVETILLQHDDIEEACVFGVPDKTWGEAIKAVCVRKPGGAVTSQQLAFFVGTRLAGYKKPKFVLFVESLPKTEDGGVNRERVKELALQSLKWTETG